MSELFFIIANQRCGTNYLRDRLNRDTDAYAVGELFYPGFDTISNHDGHFFEYYLAKIAEDRTNILLTNTVVFDRVFNEYLDYIEGMSPRRFMAVDIKSDCFLLLPRLYQIIRKRGSKIIHLVRTDKLSRAISQIVLNSVYSRDNAYKLYDDAAVNNLVLSYEDVKSNILAADGFDQFVGKFFSNSSLKRVEYERLSDLSTWDEIREFIGLEGEIRLDLISTRQKRLADKDRIANYAEIADRLKSENII